MDILLIYTIKTLLLPPASLLILAIFGLLIFNKRQKLGINIITASLLALSILSLPLISAFLASTQQSYPALTNKQLQQIKAQAIIVLGGGTRSSAPDYNNQTIIHERVFDRLRYAVRLAKKNHLPVLVSGGKVINQTQPAEAEIIRETLIKDFHFKPDWLEDKSRNTAENAHFSHAILSKQKIHRIILVTHALHMARAVEQFKNVGFEVTAAPTAFITYSNQITVLDFLPSASALEKSSMVLHELLGRWWYRIKYKKV